MSSTPKFNHKMIHYNFNNYVTVEDCLENIDRAYQKGILDERERIIEELEKAKSYYMNLYHEHMSSLDEKRAFGIKKAIDIVRGDANG